jgi:ATP-binding cassette subfamily F protein 3
LLDEPTNHLDMRAKDVLLEALREYTGTVVLVSHDRYFIDNLATRIFEIEDGHVHVYPGNYEDYLWRKSGGPEAQAQAVTAAVPAPAAQNRDREGGAKRVNPMKLKKLQAELAKAEGDIAVLESEIGKLEASMADFKSAEESMRLADLLTQRRSELETRVSQWEQISQEVEANS